MKVILRLISRPTLITSAVFAGVSATGEKKEGAKPFSPPLSRDTLFTGDHRQDENYYHDIQKNQGCLKTSLLQFIHLCLLVAASIAHIQLRALRRSAAIALSVCPGHSV
jgi:hypothetical protein